jgi:hypothetical protein
VRRRLGLAVLAVAGAVTGAAAALAVQESPAPETPTARAAVVPARMPVPTDDIFLVWTPDALPPGLVEGLPALAGVRRSTVVRGGGLDLVMTWSAEGRVVDRAPSGWAYPIDAIGVEPSSFAALTPPSARAAIAGLAPGRALLGATSARLRRLGPGGVLEMAGGDRFVVAAVVDDALVGGAELVLAAEDAAERRLPVRYALLSSTGARDQLEAGVRRLLPAGVAVRVRAPGETPFLRHGDAVLPQALVKERFGEFAYRRAAGRDIEQDPAWQAAHLVTVRLPVLGTVRCHRSVIPALQGALGELEQRNLGYLVERGGFAGCWAPRAIEAGAPLSRHAWGIALDVNVIKNPTGVTSAQDPRLVDVMRRWGFASGAQWLVPDPAHLEFLRPPAR